MDGQYANYFEIGQNAFDFVLVFGQLYANEDQVHRHTRIITGPVYAKALLEVLRESVGQYEEKFGAIVLENMGQRTAPLPVHVESVTNVAAGQVIGTESQQLLQEHAAMSSSTDQANEAGNHPAQRSGKSPDEKWNEIQRELQESETQRANLEKDIATTKDTVSYLQRVRSDISQLPATYAQALPSLQKDRQDMARYLEGITQFIDCAIGDKKHEIDKAIADFDDVTNSIGDKVEQLRNATKLADENLSQAQAQLGEDQKAFELKKAYKTDIDSKLKSLKAIRSKIDAEQAKNHIASMYFLIRELTALLNDTKIDTAEKFETDLNTVWDSLISDKREAGAGGRDAEKAGNAYKDMKSELDDRVLKRREQLLEIVSVFDQPTAEAGSSVGATSTQQVSA
jgi:chromosome segregation ATPase